MDQLHLLAVCFLCTFCMLDSKHWLSRIKPWTALFCVHEWMPFLMLTYLIAQVFSGGLCLGFYCHGFSIPLLFLLSLWVKVWITLPGEAYHVYWMPHIKPCARPSDWHNFHIVINLIGDLIKQYEFWIFLLLLILEVCCFIIFIGFMLYHWKVFCFSLWWLCAVVGEKWYKLF